MTIKGGIAISVLFVSLFPQFAYAAPVKASEQEALNVNAIQSHILTGAVKTEQIEKRTEISQPLYEIRENNAKIAAEEEKKRIALVVDEQIASYEKEKEEEQKRKQEEERRKKLATATYGAGMASMGEPAPEYDGVIPGGARKIVVSVSAYTSSPDETSGNPFITASGARVHDGTVAFNGASFGTKLMFPACWGNKIFTVEDRTARRFSNRIDIWMVTKAQAFSWGVRRCEAVILP